MSSQNPTTNTMLPAANYNIEVDNISVETLSTSESEAETTSLMDEMEGQRKYEQMNQNYIQEEKDNGCDQKTTRTIGGAGVLAANPNAESEIDPFQFQHKQETGAPKPPSRCAKAKCNGTTIAIIVAIVVGVVIGALSVAFCCSCCGLCAGAAGADSTTNSNTLTQGDSGIVIDADTQASSESSSDLGLVNQEQTGAINISGSEGQQQQQQHNQKEQQSTFAIADVSKDENSNGEQNESESRTKINGPGQSVKQNLDNTQFEKGKSQGNLSAVLPIQNNKSTLKVKKSSASENDDDAHSLSKKSGQSKNNNTNKIKESDGSSSSFKTYSKSNSKCKSESDSAVTDDNLNNSNSPEKIKTKLKSQGGDENTQDEPDSNGNRIEIDNGSDDGNQSEDIVLDSKQKQLQSQHQLDLKKGAKSKSTDRSQATQNQQAGKQQPGRSQSDEGNPKMSKESERTDIGTSNEQDDKELLQNITRNEVELELEVAKFQLQQQQPQPSALVQLLEAEDYIGRTCSFVKEAQTEMSRQLYKALNKDQNYNFLFSKGQAQRQKMQGQRQGQGQKQMKAHYKNQTKLQNGNGNNTKLWDAKSWQAWIEIGRFAHFFGIKAYTKDHSKDTSTSMGYAMSLLVARGYMVDKRRYSNFFVDDVEKWVQGLQLVPNQVQEGARVVLSFVVQFVDKRLFQPAYKEIVQKLREFDEQILNRLIALKSKSSSS